MAKVKIGNVKGPQGEQGPQGPIGATGATGQVDASTAIEFSENSSYANIESGESIATIFGKLKKIAGGILAGAGSTLLGANLTADRVLLSNSDGKITASTITATELSYLDGLTGNVQQNINSLTENKGHAYGEKFTAGNTDINISKWAVTSLLCIATYNETAMYIIRKETSTKIFCLPIKSSTQFTVAKNGENSIRLTNSAAEGGNWTVFY